MIRKLAIAVAAVAALGTASLTATTPAAAGWKGGHHHHHFHGGWGHGYRLYSGYAYDSCYRRVWRTNRFGEPVLRLINICD
jgi:hypothetical protein